MADLGNRSNTMIDNSKEIMARIENLYHTGHMADITLFVGNHVFGAHRLILSASSIVFATMFNKTWLPGQQKQVKLIESSICEDVFERFLLYLYTGKLEIGVDTVLPVLQLADKYDVKELMRVCINFMQTHIPIALRSGVFISWLQYSSAFSTRSLHNYLHNFMLHNITLLSNCTDLGRMEVESMVYVLQQNDLVVESEILLFNFVLRWLTLHMEIFVAEQLSSESQRRQEEIQEKEDYLVKCVMGHIRFPMMEVAELTSLHELPIVLRHKEYFMWRLGVGMSYQTGQQEQAARLVVLLAGETGNIIFTPRLYTANTFSLLLEIKDVNSLRQFVSQKYCFSSRTRLAADTSLRDDTLTDWSIDVFPRGVFFDKCFVIVLQGMLEIPEQVRDVFRMRLTCHGSVFPHHVMVGVCLYKTCGGIDYIYSVKQCTLTYEHFNDAKNLDNFIGCDESHLSWIHNEMDTLKITFIIMPLDKYCIKYLPDSERSYERFTQQAP